MKRTRFADEQIIGILAEHEAWAKYADLCRNPEHFDLRMSGSMRIDSLDRVTRKARHDHLG